MKLISSELQHHWLWQDKPFTKGQAWIDLLLMAENDRIVFRNKIYNLPTGQLITSEPELGKRWGWSRTKLRNFLLLLSDDSMIKIEAQSTKTFITIMHSELQTIEGPIQEQIKEQVKAQANLSDNEHKTASSKQEKKQVETRLGNKKMNEKSSEQNNMFRQRTIYDAIEEKNNEGKN